MKFYLGMGDKLPYTAPAGGVIQGIGYVIEDAFVVAEGTAAATEEFIGMRRGHFRLPKDTADAFTKGDKVWWNNTAKTCLNVSTTGAFLIGTCTADQGTTDPYLDVALDGIAVTAVP